MASNLAARPLVSIAVPESGAARLAAQVALVVAGSLLLALSAKAKVVLGPVDLSLQSLVVLLIAAAFGFRMGVATLLLYLAEGAAGFPVFQSTPEKGIGLAYMVGPTGGFLAGFLVMATIVGWAIDQGWGKSLVRLLAAMLVAEVVMFAMGMSWLAQFIGLEKAWQFGVQPFIVPDLIKVGIAAALPAAVYGLMANFRR